MDIVEDMTCLADLVSCNGAADMVEDEIVVRAADEKLATTTPAVSRYPAHHTLPRLLSEQQAAVLPLRGLVEQVDLAMDHVFGMLLPTPTMAGSMINLTEEDQQTVEVNFDGRKNWVFATKQPQRKPAVVAIVQQRQKKHFGALIDSCRKRLGPNSNINSVIINNSGLLQRPATSELTKEKQQPLDQLKKLTAKAMPSQNKQRGIRDESGTKGSHPTIIRRDDTDYLSDDEERTRPILEPRIADTRYSSCRSSVGRVGFANSNISGWLHRHMHPNKTAPKRTIVREPHRKRQHELDCKEAFERDQCANTQIEVRRIPTNILFDQKMWDKFRIKME